MRVLFSAYSVSPARGSESGTSWRIASALAERGVDITVLTSELYANEIDAGFVPRGMSIERVDAASPVGLRSGQRGVYSKYLVWQRAAYQRAISLHSHRPFDLLHHFSWGSLPWGSPLWRLGAPFIFGPVGGGQPPMLADELPRNDRCRQWLRRAALRASNFNPRSTQTVRHARLCLAANTDTLDLLQALGAKRLQLMLPDLTPAEYLASAPLGRGRRDTSTILWVGRLLPLKGVTLALRVLAHLPDHVVLRVVGDGPDMNRARAFARDHGLTSRVDFVGLVPWHSVAEYYDAATMFLFTSLRDSSGPQLLEAAARGLPIVGLNHHGTKDWVPSTAGCLVPVDTADVTAKRIAAGIQQLLADESKWVAASHESRRMAESHAAAAHAAELEQHYQDVVSG